MAKTAKVHIREIGDEAICGRSGEALKFGSGRKVTCKRCKQKRASQPRSRASRIQTVEDEPEQATEPAAEPAKPMSALDAAAKVLQEAGEAMNCQQLIAAMAERGYWESPSGKTPERTLYSEMLREIKRKGHDSRFQRVKRGHFERTAS